MFAVGGCACRWANAFAVGCYLCRWICWWGCLNTALQATLMQVSIVKHAWCLCEKTSRSSSHRTGPTHLNPGLRWVGMLGARKRMSPRANLWSQASSYSTTILPHMANDADRKDFGRKFGRCGVCRWRMRLSLEWCVCRWRIRLPLESAFCRWDRLICKSFINYDTNPYPDY